jgi:hypothetical protein
MREIQGNIWDYHTGYIPVVITTNCDINSQGNAIMGKGIALEAKKKFPKLPLFLAQHIKRFYDKVKFFPEYNIFCLPTKEHYWENSNLLLIEEGILNLRSIVNWYNEFSESMMKKVYLPRLGCGCGNLKWENVKPLIETYLDDRFIVINK